MQLFYFCLFGILVTLLLPSIPHTHTHMHLQKPQPPSLFLTTSALLKRILCPAQALHQEVV